MWDWLRRWLQSAESRRQETITAYVDNALTPAAKQRFEAVLMRDPALQAEVTRLQQFKAGLRQLPRLNVPRNFTLDPARYGKPAPAPEVRLYPAFRLATALAGVLFVLAIGLSLSPSLGGRGAAQMAAPESAEMAPFNLALETPTAEETLAEQRVQDAPAVGAALPTETSPGDFTIAAAATPALTNTLVSPSTTNQVEPVSAETVPNPPSSLLPDTVRLLGLGGLFTLLLAATLLLRRRLIL